MTTPNTAQPFDLLQQGQDAAMKLVGELSEAFTALTRGNGGLGGLIPGGPAAMVDRFYDAGVQILEAQRAMAHGALEVAGPALQAFSATDGARGR